MVSRWRVHKHGCRQGACQYTSVFFQFVSICPSPEACHDLGGECQVRYALQLVSFVLASFQLSLLGVNTLFLWKAEAPTAGSDSKSSGHARNYVHPKKDYIEDISESCNAQQQNMADKDIDVVLMSLIVHIHKVPGTNNTEVKATLKLNFTYII